MRTYLFCVSRTSEESDPSPPTLSPRRVAPFDWVIALTSRPMPVEELPESNPGVFVDVSIVLPLTMGCLY
jgi:hypothetical protein